MVINDLPDDIFQPLEELRACNICPRKCNADRFSSKKGYCRAGTEFSISSICIHRGEEPVISGSKGICNVFFTNCNLQCVFCQNWQISDNSLDHSYSFMELDKVLRQITYILDTGIPLLGFVSPGHFIPQVKVIINALKHSGYEPGIVYNSNGYDDVGQLRSLEGMVDVYLPDFKYMDESLSARYSDAGDYPEVALAAHREMFRQTGPNLLVDNEGYAMRGMLIRHLVLPGHTENSIKILETIAGELSPRVHVALMSQYYPCHRAGEYEMLNAHVDPGEYMTVVKKMSELGISRGFVQGMDSPGHYRPDFDAEQPFL
jgi:putative pyruvate formate lyase activating enzyme